MPRTVHVKRRLLYAFCAAFLCLCVNFQPVARANAEPLQGKEISISVRKSSLASILNQVSKKSGITIYFVDTDISGYTNIDYDAKDKEVTNILTELFKGKDLQYEVISEKQIGVRKARKSQSTNIEERDTLLTVTGQVTDEKGSPIVGATVVPKGNVKLGTTTNKEGKFVLSGVKANASLVISSVSFLTTEVAIAGRMSIGEVTLKEFIKALDEVQIIAYGEVEKKFSTSDIITIKAEEIARQPVSNPLLTLAGRTPGVFIKQGSGVTASPVTLNVQGQNSLQNSNEPLYVIDGVPYAPQFTDNSLMGTAIAGFGGSTFNFINSGDIESISILKDADATAIYGSRAANGAVLITTKKGAAGKTKVDFNLQNGWGQITRRIDLMNTHEYLEIRKERYKNDGQEVPAPGTSPNFTNYDLTFWDQNKYTDWQELLVGGTAKFTDLQGSISGGNAQTQFLAGYGYHRETTVYPGGFYDQKGNVRFNLNHRSNNNKFKYMLSGSYLQAKNTLASGDLMARVLSLAPNSPDLYLPNGKLNWGYLPNGVTASFANPLTITIQRFTGRTSNMIADNVIGYEIIPGLELKASIGYNKLEGSENNLRPLAFFRPTATTRVRTASYLEKSITTWIVEPQMTYNKTTSFGTFDILIGSTFQQTKTDILQQSGSGYPTDAQLEDLFSAPTKNVDLTVKNLYRYTAGFGRLNYRLYDKYILNINLRRDGSSRFGAENKFHTFYGIGGAWLFGDESVVKNNLSWLSFGKIRASYGTTGNDQISDYRYLSLVTTYPQAQIAYQDGLSYYPTRIANPFLQWEETRKLNLGIDLGFLKNRIILNLTYARNRSSNQLVGSFLPRITGFSAIDENLPALIQNTSFEGQINAAVVKTKRINWNISGNITVPKNKLISFPGLEKTGYESIYTVGDPTNVIRAYQFAGVNPETGLYQFLNSKGQLTSTPSATDDMTARVNLNPKFYGGISNSINYKGFQLDFLFQFVKQTAQTARFGTGAAIAGEVNFPQLRDMLKRWQKPGDIADYQKVGLSEEVVNAYFYALTSTGQYGDASYIRLKNAALSYSLPKSLISKVNMTNVRLYIQGQNLLTITDFKGGDPETVSIGILPPLQMLTLGIQVTF